jgi:hypothetical protein
MLQDLHVRDFVVDSRRVNLIRELSHLSSSSAAHQLFVR